MNRNQVNRTPAFRKAAALLLVLVLCLACLPALAGETVTFKGATFDSDAEYIDLGDVTVASGDVDKFYAFLAKMPNLKQVDMFATKIGRLRIEALQERFPEIQFGMTMVLAKHVIRTDATAFSCLHGYKTFEHSSLDLSILKNCTNLYALDLGHNLIDDLDLLYSLPKLRVLILACNNITDITPIASLKDLEYLEIFKNDIHDVTPLAELPHLVDLNITSNRIQDITPLKNVKTLRRLWIYNCNAYSRIIPVPPDQVEVLRKALPDARVDDLSHGTEGGWREGSHYDTIFRIFNGTDGYEPFDDVRYDSYAYEFEK